MSKIDCIIKGEEFICDRKKIPSGNEFALSLRCSFSEEWANLSKYACFLIKTSEGDITVERLIESGEVDVSDIFDGAEFVEFGFIGCDADQNVIKSTNVRSIMPEDGAYIVNPGVKAHNLTIVGRFEGVEKTANDARSVSNNALSKASNAEGVARNAKETAERANTLSGEAKSASNEAKAAAGSAASSANAASESAQRASDIAEGLLEDAEKGVFDGVGIEKVEQVIVSEEDGGENVMDVVLTDGRKSEFKVRNGSGGAPGVSPVVSVDEFNGGHRVNIEGANGVTSFDVMNGLALKSVDLRKVTDTKQVPEMYTATVESNFIKTDYIGLEFTINVTGYVKLSFANRKGEGIASLTINGKTYKSYDGLVKTFEGFVDSPINGSLRDYASITFDEFLTEADIELNIKDGEGKGSLQQIGNNAEADGSFAIGCGSVTLNNRALLEENCTFVGFDKGNNKISARIDVTSSDIVYKIKAFRITTTPPGDKVRTDIVKVNNVEFDYEYHYFFTIETPINELVLDSSDVSTVSLTAIVEDTSVEASGLFAEGEGSFAIGDVSHAEGRKTLAADEYAHSEGWGTVAYGRASHAEGYNTRTTGNYSHSEGCHTVAYYADHAEGMNCEATGTYGAHAEGVGTKAIGSQGSHSEGQDTIASGTRSHAEGHGSVASGNHGSHAEGRSTKASGDYSHSENQGTTASGVGSHSEGYDTVATRPYQHVQGKRNYLEQTGTDAEGNPIYDAGNYAHIVGNGTDSTRRNAHTLDWDGNAWYAGNVAVGANKEKLITEAGAKSIVDTKMADFRLENGSASYSIQQRGSSSSASAPSATGSYSVALGLGTVASNTVSCAVNYRTQATGIYSFSEGRDSVASGSVSHAEGRGTVAKGENQHVQGRYNKEDAENKYAHIVGNGNTATGARSNAHTLDWSGNAWFAGDITFTYNGKEYKLSDLLKRIEALEK